MATQSSILAWRILWTEESGELQSKGSQRVGHDLSDLARKQTGGLGKGNEVFPGWEPSCFLANFFA